MFRSNKLVALLVCMLMLAAYALPAGAGAVTPCFSWYSEYDKEKLLAFWQQEAYDGRINGDAVYDHEWNSMISHPEYLHYDGSFMTELLSIVSNNGFNFNFTYSVPFFFEEVDPETGEILFGDGEDEVYPDLYGSLDLEGTSAFYIGSPLPNQTHITSINVNNCDALSCLLFNGQSCIRSIDAVGCQELLTFSAKDDPCTHIAVSLRGVNDPLCIEALGPGAVGAEFDHRQGNNGVKLYAYPSLGKFIGWYRNGELISADPDYTNWGSGSLIAYFGGDADGDLVITTSDALLTLRAALGLDADIADPNAVDLDSNGTIETDDALIILRLALGIY